jgi:putative flippase GtrA
VLATLVDTAVFALAELIFRPAMADYSVWVSNPLAWLIATAFAFFTNKLFVFEQKSWLRKTVAREAISFFSARLLSLGMGQLLLHVFAVVLRERLQPVLDQIWTKTLLLTGDPAMIYTLLVKFVLVGGLVMALNYIFSKLFIFKKEKEL